MSERAPSDLTPRQLPLQLVMCMELLSLKVFLKSNMRSIQFHFYANATYGVHAVAVADYNTPCVPAAGSFFSGFLEGDAEGKTTFSYNVQDTNTKVCLLSL